MHCISGTAPDSGDQQQSSLPAEEAACNPTATRNLYSGVVSVEPPEVLWPTHRPETIAANQQKFYSARPVKAPPLKAMQTDSVEALDQGQCGAEFPDTSGHGPYDATDMQSSKVDSKAPTHNATGAYAAQDFSFRGVHELVRSGLQSSNIHNTFPAGRMQALNQMPATPQAHLKNTASHEDLPSSSAVHLPIHDQEGVFDSDPNQQPDEHRQSHAATNDRMPLCDSLGVSGGNTHAWLPDNSACKQNGTEQGTNAPAVAALNAPSPPEPNIGEYDAQSPHIPSDTAHPREPTEQRYSVGSHGITESSALNEYNRAKRFGPRVPMGLSPFSPGCKSLRSRNPDKHVLDPVKQSPPEWPRSVSSPCKLMPAACISSFYAASSPFSHKQQHCVAHDKVLPSIDQHTEKWPGRSLGKENTMRPGRCCKNSMQWFSSSESPVSVHGLDIWSCSALQNELQQVEKTLRASRRSRCHAHLSAAHEVATSLNEGPKRARGTMSSILARMRQGSLQRSPRKNYRQCRSQERQDRNEGHKTKCMDGAASRDGTRRRLIQGNRQPLDRRKGSMSRTGRSTSTTPKVGPSEQEVQGKKNRQSRVKYVAFPTKLFLQ